MRVIIARTMPEFSMDVYANGLIAGLRAVRPDWKIVEVAPYPLDRNSRSWSIRLWKYYERFWRFPRAVKQQAADIFHVIDHSDGHLVYWLKKTGKPVVVTCHDLINFFYRENLQGSVQLPFISSGAWQYSVRGIQHANHVIAISSNTAKDTTQILNIEPERIAVVPDAVESLFRPLPKNEVESFRQKYNILPETICLLNVGSTHPRKNISTILKVVEVLKQRGLTVRLWKAGSDFTDEQKAFIRVHGLEDHIAYLGKPDKQTLVQIYNAADILLAPSLHEGFGMTILEAMACGTPVITSNVSALPEVAGDAAVLIDPMDVQAIVKAVYRLQDDSTYRKWLIEQGLARVKLFTWEMTAEQIAEVYEKATEWKREGT